MLVLGVANAYKYWKEKHETNEPDCSLEETVGCLRRIQSQIANDEMMHLSLRVVQDTENTLKHSNPLCWADFGVKELSQNPQVQARHTAGFMISLLENNPEIPEAEFVRSIQGFVIQQGYGRIFSKSFELSVCMGLIDSYLKHRDRNPQPASVTREHRSPSARVN